MTSNMRKPAPFYAPGVETPITPAEIQRRIRRDNRCAEIGEGYARFSSDDEEFENPFRIIAYRDYISKDIDVPEELKRKIMQADKEHAIRR